MKSHQFLQSEEELDKFLSTLREAFSFERDEVGLLFLFSRNKYLSEEERKLIDLSRANVVGRQILKNFETSTVVQALHKMEALEGAYLDRSGNPIPNEVLVPYISYNPVSPIKAFSDTQKCFVEYLMELDRRQGDKENTYSRLARIDQQYFTQLHHAFSRHIFMDFDFDIPERSLGATLTQEFMDRIKSHGGVSLRVKTRSGYHVLVKRDTLNYNYNLDLEEVRHMAGEALSGEPSKKWEIEKNPNGQLPLPGTLQKDHLVVVDQRVS